MKRTLRNLGPFVLASWGCSSSDAGALAPTLDASVAVEAGVGADAGQVGADAGGGGAPGDAASTAEGGTPDAGSDAATAACKALFCEDFETGKLDTTRWELDVGYDAANTVTVQAAKVRRGGFAAHAHLASTGGGFANIRTKAPFPALASDLWGRAYVLQTVDATVGHNALVKMESNGAGVLEVGQSMGKVQLTFYPPTGENPAGYATSIPEAKWTCLEWHMAKTAPQIELFADGVSLASYTYSGAAAIPTFSAIKLGLETHSSNTSTDDVYIDDVALDRARIGCLP
jgi:hypothetical protein